MPLASNFNTTNYNLKTIRKISMQTISEKVTSTVGPVIERTAETAARVVEGTISVVERLDPEAKQR